MGRPCQFITRGQIVALNKQVINSTQGLYIGEENLAQPNSLDYILDAVTATMFGEDRYRTVIDKAAALGFHIITRHIFHDGNKRTSLLTCALFLAANGLNMRLLPKDEVRDFTIWIADKEKEDNDLSVFTEWVRQQTIPTDEPEE